jgi:hypothetical protein
MVDSGLGRYSSCYFRHLAIKSSVTTAEMLQKSMDH